MKKQADTKTTPTTDKSPQISVRLPAALLEQIDAAADALNVNRAAWLKMTLTKVLNPAGKGE